MNDWRYGAPQCRLLFLINITLYVPRLLLTRPWTTVFLLRSEELTIFCFTSRSKMRTFFFLPFFIHHVDFCTRIGDSVGLIAETFCICSSKTKPSPAPTKSKSRHLQGYDALWLVTLCHRGVICCQNKALPHPVKILLLNSAAIINVLVFLYHKI